MKHHANPAVSMLVCPRFFSTHCNFGVLKYRNQSRDVQYVLSVPQIGYTQAHVKLEKRNKKNKAGFLLERRSLKETSQWAFHTCKQFKSSYLHF